MSNFQAKGASSDGRWVVGMRPNMGGKFTLYQLRKIDGKIVPVFVQDIRTGADALFDTKKEALKVMAAIIKGNIAIAE